MTLKWFALHTKLDKPSPVHPAGTDDERLTRQVGLVVGDRVEHGKHGKGRVSSANGTTHNHPVYADGAPLGVLIEFDNGETHNYI